MVTIGIDAHKRTHTAVIVNEHGARIATRTITSTSSAHHPLLEWARSHDTQRLWAIEDCRHLSRRLERDLLAAGEQIIRVPPKLMAATRTSARSYRKSDPIDALAVARAAQTRTESTRRQRCAHSIEPARSPESPHSSNTTMASSRNSPATSRNAAKLSRSRLTDSSARSQAASNDSRHHCSKSVDADH